MAGNRNSGPRPGARAHRDDAVLNLHEQEHHLELIDRGFAALETWLAHARRRVAAAKHLGTDSLSAISAAQEIEDAREEIASTWGLPA